MINLFSVVNMKARVASVALIGLFNEGCKACTHEEKCPQRGANVKSLRRQSWTALSPVSNHCGLSLLSVAVSQRWTAETFVQSVSVGCHRPVFAVCG